MEKYEIRDWTNALCFGGRRFESFEDGWAFLYENEFIEEDAYQEYYVVPIEGELR